MDALGKIFRRERAASSDLKQPTSSSVYRPLDQTKNEIRLLRIIPSTRHQGTRLSHKAASDIIVCELEYESLDEIEEDNRRRDAEESHENDLYTTAMRMLGQNTGPLVFDDFQDVRAHRAQQQLVYQWTGEESLRRGSKDDYHINSFRLTMLRVEYLKSLQIMTSWLPEQYQHLLQRNLTFEHWLQNLIRSPLSEHPDYAESTGLGYYALSYMWADLPFPLHDTNLRVVLKLAEAGGLGMKDLLKNTIPLKQKKIILNGRKVSVGENLYQALGALREIPEVRNGTRIWVDSLCIDQSNITERSNEVKRMDQIYSKADRVVSHIGTPDNHANEVLQIMELIGFATCDRDGADRLREWFRTQTNSPFFHYFALLMSRGYWSRIWIMQEIALASEKSILICGMKRYPLTDLLSFGKWQTQSTMPPFLPIRASPIGRAGLPSPNESGQPIMTLGTLMDGSARLKNIFELRQLIEVNQTRLEMFNTLWFRTAAENRASDPRDLIYGMLALLPAALVERIHVDYADSNTYQQVMIDFATSHIATYDSLHWILFRPWHSFPNCQEWPSWVPNLGLPFNASQFWWTIGDWRAYWGIDETRDWARNENGLLHCRGFKYDTVQQTTSPVLEGLVPDASVWTELPDFLEGYAKDPSLPAESLISSALPQTLNLSSSLFYNEIEGTTAVRSENPLDSCEHRYNDQEGLQAAVATCLDQLQLGTPTQPDAIFSIPIDVIHNALLYQAFLPRNTFGSPFIDSKDVGMQYLSSFLRHNENFSLWGARLADFFAAPCDDPTEFFMSATLPSFARPGRMPPVLDQTSQTARMFTTASGYLGVAPGDLRVGDEIFILHKCRMPVALRPSTGRPGAYKVLGGVFVHGIMQGDAVTGHLGNGQFVEDVTLC
ncbi:hypothetical protein BP5796_13126 [Coleophoma crateriformis]|uniref:Heterokaryon incompatibility domain-containing protein n=1 Tax=Coleophoma crateriformis TaxID=565419 RepID=A0A3D8Q3M2_9HELO|nr:hypothetical protein BP5796_13126 [Coleophoma crateriformis]